jgi:hypothetical protein
MRLGVDAKPEVAKECRRGSQMKVAKMFRARPYSESETEPFSIFHFS